MKWLPFNVNQTVRIRLTLYGRHAYDVHFRRLGLPTPEIPEVDGWSTWQLWEVMRYFGNQMYMGNVHSPFEMDMQIEDRDAT